MSFVFNLKEQGRRIYRQRQTEKEAGKEADEWEAGGWRPHSLSRLALAQGPHQEGGAQALSGSCTPLPRGTQWGTLPQ